MIQCTQSEKEADLVPAGASATSLMVDQRKFTPPSPTVTVTTDACTLGYGAHGHLNTWESRFYISVLKSRSVRWVLKACVCPYIA